MKRIVATLIGTFLILTITTNCSNREHQEVNDQKETSIESNQNRVVSYVAGYRKFDFSTIQ